MPVVTVDDATTLVRTLAKKLTTQAADAEKWKAYYEGRQSLKFASAEWRAWFGELYEGFSDNWCAAVVDATAERQRWVGFRPFESKAADIDLQRVMAANGADLEFGLAMTEAQFARRSFATVWGNPADEKTPIVSYESPTQMIVTYEPGARRTRAAALKLWRSDDGKTAYATLYTPTHIWKFARGQGIDRPAGFKGEWIPRKPDDDDVWPIPNPFGVVPVVELPNRSTLTGEPQSAIASVAAMQDAINLLWAHLFTSSDFAALPQRVLLGAQLPKIPVFDADGKKVGEKVVDLAEANIKRILNIESSTAKIDSWPAADLAKFLEVIKVAVNHIANQTRTPAYYLVGGTTFANISADAVKALDAGLVQKVLGLNATMSDPLREVAWLICKAQGDEKKALAMRSGVVLFGNPEIRSDAQLADALLKYSQIGFPFQWIVEQKVDDPDKRKSIVDAWEANRRDTTLENVARDLASSRSTVDMTAAAAEGANAGAE